MTYTIELAKSFKKFKKLMSCKQELFSEVSKQLASGESLDKKYNDYALQGKYSGFRECHLKPDLLLIYKKRLKSSWNRQ